MAHVNEEDHPVYFPTTRLSTDGMNHHSLTAQHHHTPAVTNLLSCKG